MCQYCLLNKCKLRIIRKDKMPRIFILFTSLILLYASSASGDEINYQFTSISVEEGLSQSTVQSILLDKKGKLWIGTRNGLNFYTGQDLTEYTGLEATWHFLQPCSCRNTKEVVEYILHHPQWRLSLQTHKLINIR